MFGLLKKKRLRNRAHLTESDKKRTDKKRHHFDFLDIRNRRFKVGHRKQETASSANKCAWGLVPPQEGMGWFLGQISRAAPPQTSHTYDYRVVLA